MVSPATLGQSGRLQGCRYRGRGIIFTIDADQRTLFRNSAIRVEAN